MKGRVSLLTAALAGFIYATVMCLWVYFDRGLSVDQLLIRFAAYFSVFTLGFYSLYNFVVGQLADRNGEK